MTCSASEVLEHQTGYCYAKSHLLCALLRANQIPAGLCYQRLSVGDGGPPFCLHGLNALWLSDLGWYRIDSPGNRGAIDAQFTPPLGRLAFNPDGAGEHNIDFVYSKPLSNVVAALKHYKTWDALGRNLP